MPDVVPESRCWLRLHGIFYETHTYFNSIDLGRHAGYFAPQEYELTRWMAAENTLILEVACERAVDRINKRTIMGVFDHWDSMDTSGNPGGVWLPVEIIRTGPIRIGEVLLQTASLGDAQAELRYRVALDSAQAADVMLRWTFTPQNFVGAIQTVEQRRALAQGRQEIGGVVQVRDPQIWWTHDLGHPSVYRVTLEVLSGEHVSDAYQCGFGIRTFELRDWIAYLNGVRLYLKGSNYPPTAVRLAGVTRAQCDADLRLAQECHMNMLRVHSHVAHPALYDAADAAGVLLWQDFPLQWYYSRDVQPEAERQVRAMVRLLGNHPSVALWCMHNEPIAVADTSDQSPLAAAAARVAVFTPNWCRNVLDTQLQRIVEEEDSTRPVVRSSGEYAVPGVYEGTDTHFYFGWYPAYGPLRDFDGVIRTFPQNVRFVTEFGAQSFPQPESAARFLPENLAAVDWKQVAKRHQLQPEILDRWVVWRAAQSLDELAEITQAYQIHVHRWYVDRLRRAKYSPNGGLLQFMFHDPNPSISWSVLDHWRVPKRSYAALQLAYSPQYFFALVSPDGGVAGRPLDIPLCVVNDAHRPVPVRLTASLVAPDGQALAGFERDLDLPADSLAIEIEHFRLTPAYPGTYRLSLVLRMHDATLLEQVYALEIVPAVL